MFRRPFFAGLGLVLALVATAMFGSVLLDDPEHSRPPHVAPPAAEVTAPPPLSAVGGDSTAALEQEYRAFIEGVQREQERIAAEEAERVAAAERARRQQGTGSRAGSGSPCADEWECLRQCEAGGNYGANTGNGFYGAYQFLPSTWRGAVSGAGHAEYADGLPSDAPPEVQDAAARHLQSVRGWQPWPGCSAKLGLR